MDEWCPLCHRPELNTAENCLFIRGYKWQDKHGDWSQCLVCDIWFTDEGRIKRANTPPDERCYTSDGKTRGNGVYDKVRHRWIYS